MIEKTETPCCVVVVVSLHVDLRDGAVDIIRQLGIVCAGSASFVFVSWNIGSIWNQGTETVSRDEFVS